MDALNSLLLISHRGPHDYAQGTQVDGVWREGATLRATTAAPR